jgi:hypothetical protein
MWSVRGEFDAVGVRRSRRKCVHGDALHFSRPAERENTRGRHAFVSRAYVFLGLLCASDCDCRIWYDLRRRSWVCLYKPTVALMRDAINTRYVLSAMRIRMWRESVQSQRHPRAGKSPKNSSNVDPHSWRVELRSKRHHKQGHTGAVTR